MLLVQSFKNSFFRENLRKPYSILSFVSKAKVLKVNQITALVFGGAKCFAVTTFFRPYSFSNIFFLWFKFYY